MTAPNVVINRQRIPAFRRRPLEHVTGVDDDRTSCSPPEIVEEGAFSTDIKLEDSGHHIPYRQHGSAIKYSTGDGGISHHISYRLPRLAISHRAVYLVSGYWSATSKLYFRVTAPKFAASTINYRAVDGEISHHICYRLPRLAFKHSALHLVSGYCSATLTFYLSCDSSTRCY